MTENPYEAPQTIDRPLPLANMAPSLQTEQLARLQGARNCAKAGIILLGAMMCAVLFFGIITWRDAVENLPEWKVAATIFLVSTFVLLLWGMIRNLLGYARFMQAEKLEQLAQIYKLCRLHSWLRLCFVCFFFAAPMLLSPVRNVLLQVLFCTMPLLSLTHTIWLHGRAMDLWKQRLGSTIAPHVTQFFVVIGLSTTGLALLMAVYDMTANTIRESSPFQLLVLSGIFAVMFAAYSWMYRRLARALANHGLTEEET